MADECEVECQAADLDAADMQDKLARATPFWPAWFMCAACAIGAAVGGYLIR